MSMRLSVGMAFSEERAFSYLAIIGHREHSQCLPLPSSLPLCYSRAMANDEHVALLKQGVNTWNAWRQEHESIGHCQLNGSQPNMTTIYCVHNFFEYPISYCITHS